MSAPRIAFLGAGNLATAIVRGLLAKNEYSARQIGCTSKTGTTAERLARETGILFEPDLPTLLRDADVVIVAFKPQSLASADPRLTDLTRGRLVISLLAGKRLTTLAASFPHARNLVRTMPNTPAAIGAGITPFSPHAPLTPDDRRIVESLLGALGKFLELDEKHLNAVTALSAGGPAFLFEYVAAMRDAGISAGLTAADSHLLAVETVLGSARLLARSHLEPEKLRDQVVSPNGTTYAGLQVMAARNFRETIKETILAATRRAEELSKL